jgi:hypothetical protein
MNKNIALIVLFNHRYDKNLPILEDLYKERFSNRFYLVPFYDGDMENVIPVYGRSIFFEIYIAQAYNILRAHSFDYYYIIADDMIINPAINETNILDFFELNDGESWIPHLRRIQEQQQFWLGTLAAYTYRPVQKYVETEGELPSVEEAVRKFAAQGLDAPMRLSRKDVFREFTLKTAYMADKARLAIRILTRMRHPFRKSANLAYPIAASYSDTLLVSGETMPKFAHYCGVFGATSLFVEVAIPTALVLASDKKIKTEKDISKSGRSYWKTADNVFCDDPSYTWDNLEKEYKNLDDMMARFPQNAIYLHPVKLSKWMKK